MFGGVNYLFYYDLLFDKYVFGSDGCLLIIKWIREIVFDNKGNIWVGIEDDGINILDIVFGQVN